MLLCLPPTAVREDGDVAAAVEAFRAFLTSSPRGEDVELLVVSHPTDKAKVPEIAKMKKPLAEILTAWA